MASNKIKIGNYVVGETLGEGSFGKVKVAHNELTGHKVAMKIINRQKIASGELAAKVKKEIQYLKLLKHPHIIRLYEVITTPTDILMIMEYAGGELFDLIVRNGKLKEAEARRYFQQIICAIDYCHKHKIVHRDLKPENLLLDAHNDVKIADFGLSNAMSDGDFLKTSCGSPNYAAPEVISGQRYSGPEVDVWSCGVILYVLVCGHLPFDDDYIPSLFLKITGGIFSIPDHVGPEVKEILVGALTVDPVKRITAKEIRQSRWFQENLPSYLLPSWKEAVDDFTKLDDEVLQELVKKLNVSRIAIENYLKSPADHHVKVCYQLTADAKKFNGMSPPTFVKGGNAIVSINQPESVAAVAAPSSISILAPAIKRLDEKRNKKMSKWHFGIRSHSDPKDIMLEIYRALKNLNMEWRCIDPYRIRFRPLGGDPRKKVEIQLYRVEEKGYLVDFTNRSAVDYTAFFFFRVCSKVITELAIP